MSTETRIGKFFAAPGKTVGGELSIAGPQSLIILRDEKFFAIEAQPNLCITGSLYDQTQITLVGCIQIAAQSHSIRGQAARSHSVTLFPHFVTEGRAHFNPAQAVIRAIWFTFDDAPSLFYDFDAFGSALEPSRFINDIVKANSDEFNRPIRTGLEPQIAYFAGQRTIFEADTALGAVRAEHCPSWPVGGPRGVRIDNRIWTTITPATPIGFEDAVDCLMSLLRFITVAVGRRQNLPQFVIDVGTGDARMPLTVHWSHFPHRIDEQSRAREDPQPADLPLDPIRNTREFVSVLSAWLAADTERRVARLRLDESMSQGNFYSVDRLVGSANAFDLLPESAVPKRVALSPELAAVKVQARGLFRALPESDERQSLLNDLGRLGRASLKQKVRHRAGLILAVTGKKFPELDWVCNQAVECRNHFVHGSPLDFELDHPSTNQSFLTDTLEFVLAASELVEAGWDITRFLSTPTSMSHPFGAYRIHYREGLEALRASVKKENDEQADDT